MGGQLIQVDRVARAVADITRGLEQGSPGTLAALIRSRSGFEHWWKGTIMTGFTQAPWKRRPGQSVQWDSKTGVAMESDWELADRRMRFARGGAERSGLI